MQREPAIVCSAEVEESVWVLSGGHPVTITYTSYHIIMFKLHTDQLVTLIMVLREF